MKLTTRSSRVTARRQWKSNESHRTWLNEETGLLNNYYRPEMGNHIKHD